MKFFSKAKTGVPPPSEIADGMDSTALLKKVRELEIKSKKITLIFLQENTIMLLKEKG